MKNSYYNMIELLILFTNSIKYSCKHLEIFCWYCNCCCHFYYSIGKFSRKQTHIVMLQCANYIIMYKALSGLVANRAERTPAAAFFLLLSLLCHLLLWELSPPPPHSTRLCSSLLNPYPLFPLFKHSFQLSPADNMGLCGVQLCKRKEQGVWSLQAGTSTFIWRSRNELQLSVPQMLFIVFFFSFKSQWEQSNQLAARNVTRTLSSLVLRLVFAACSPAHWRGSDTGTQKLSVWC